MSIDRRIVAFVITQIAKQISLAKDEGGLFKTVFREIRSKAKKFKEQESLKAGKWLQETVIKDLVSKGMKVSLELKLGKYKGARFVTSAKLYASPKTEPFEGEDDPKVLELEAYLKSKYSPKYKLKSVDGDGVAFFNIR